MTPTKSLQNSLKDGTLSVISIAKRILFLVGLIMLNMPIDTFLWSALNNQQCFKEWRRRSRILWAPQCLFLPISIVPVSPSLSLSLSLSLSRSLSLSFSYCPESPCEIDSLFYCHKLLFFICPLNETIITCHYSRTSSWWFLLQRIFFLFQFMAI